MELAHKKPKALIIVTIILVVTAGAAVLAYIKLRPQQSAATAQPTATRVETPSEPTTPKPVMVSLPNATPIEALKENYNSDSSLWRVVSKDYPLTNSHYVPAGLELATVPSRTDKSTLERSLRSDIMPATEQLFAALKAAGYDMMIGSGYRSFEQQTIYFTNYSKQYGEAAANQFSARPGQSEHQTGLTFDIAYSNRQCYLEACFGDSAAGQWLAAHSYEYGFILRYPKDKTAITKYVYEPWHFRYVGKDLARALHESGLTLDEAIPYLQNALLRLKENGSVTE